MIDRRLFRETYQHFDKSVIVEIIDIFLEEYPTRLQQLELDIMESDFVRLRYHAHSLKGVISSFSANELTGRVRSFEKEAVDLIETGGENFNRQKLLEDLSEISKMITEMVDDLKIIRPEYQ